MHSSIAASQQRFPTCRCRYRILLGLFRFCTKAAALCISCCVSNSQDDSGQCEPMGRGCCWGGRTAALFLRGAKVDRVEALSRVCFPASAVSGRGTLVPEPDAASHHHTTTAAGTTAATGSHTTTAAATTAATGSHTTLHSAISLLFNRHC